MEKMSRRNFVGQNAVGAVSLYALTGSALVAAGQKAPRLERMSVANIGQDLQQFVPRMMQHVGVPGLSLDVISDGKITWSHAFGISGSR